jgi:NTP pyrophosphatase (non-canonical NTP hydrolase)
MATHKRYSEAMLLRDEIRRLDLVHRRGYRLSERPGIDATIASLRGEITELEDAIRDAEPRDAQHRELGDIFAVLLDLAVQLGLSFEALDRVAEEKLRLRFIGAEVIVIP